VHDCQIWTQDDAIAVKDMFDRDNESATFGSGAPAWGSDALTM
jgi:hypothetical protein